MVFHAKSPAASGSAWIPLLYDTVVLILTLYRTLPSIRSRETQAGDIVSVILRDGILYYRLVLVTCGVISHKLTLRIRQPDLRGDTCPDGHDQGCATRDTKYCCSVSTTVM